MKQSMKQFLHARPRPPAPRGTVRPRPGRVAGPVTRATHPRAPDHESEPPAGRWNLECETVEKNGRNREARTRMMRFRVPSGPSSVR